MRLEWEQIRDRQAESGRQPKDVQKADIALTTFDAANVGAMKPGTIRQFFLRHSSGKPKLTNPLSKLLEVSFH